MASFTSVATDLAVAFDGLGSTDADGTVASYAWGFGDGSTSTLQKPGHTYAAAGTYSVTLTVKDDKGLASAVTTKSVTVPATAAFASDSFTRTSSSSWGTAVVGGPWTHWGGNAALTVDGSQGLINIAQPGWAARAQLQSVSELNTEIKASIALDKIAGGGGTYVSITGRTGGFSSEYRAKVWVKADGSVNLSTVAMQSSEKTLKSINVSGLTVAANEKLWVRMQVEGTGSSSLKAKVWKDGTAEPAGWIITSSDATPELQDAGGVGIAITLSGSATGASRVSIDDFWAGPLGSAP